MDCLRCCFVLNRHCSRKMREAINRCQKIWAALTRWLGTNNIHVDVLELGVWSWLLIDRCLVVPLHFGLMAWHANAAIDKWFLVGRFPNPIISQKNTGVWKSAAYARWKCPALSRLQYARNCEGLRKSRKVIYEMCCYEIVFGITS